MLIKEEWPMQHPERKDQAAFDDLQVLIDVVTAVRKLRIEQNVEAGKAVALIIQTDAHADLLLSQADHIKRLAKVEELTVEITGEKPPESAATFLKGIEIYLPLAGLIDTDKERESLQKEQQNLQKFRDGIAKKLANKQFTEKAPKEVVDAENVKLEEVEGKLEKIKERLEALS
jgi:valyl-tRNA synthetase